MCADAAGGDTTQVCVKKMGSPNVFKNMRFCNQYTLRFDIGASPPSPRRLDRLCVQMQQVETLCVSKK